MVYCNNRLCKNITRCKNHIINCKNGSYEVKDFNCNGEQYKPIICPNCGKYPIHAKMVCKSCYNKIYGQHWDNKYKPTGKRRGRPAGKKNTIIFQKERGLCQYPNCDHIADATSEYCWKHYQKIRRSKVNK